jgi:CHAT domain-containing protein/tetratricopeptide (TPR) repeat protein
LLLAACFAGCTGKKAEEPGTRFETIRADFLHGNLDVAQEAASAARREVDPVWSMQFRLLEAEILVYQGRGEEMLALLTDPKVPYPATGDPAIKRLILLALVHSNASKPDEADRELRAARALAIADHSPLMGEVLRTEGQIHVAHDDLQAAVASFRESLNLARQLGDDYLAATDLLNIGFVSLETARYDEAIPELQRALEFAERIHAQVLAQAALGNIGQSYLQLGDFEHALTIYLQAEQQARESGARNSQVIWLQDAGYSYLKLGNLTAAREYDEKALAAAQALHATTQIISIETNLAFLSFQQEEYEAARARSEVALREALAQKDERAAAAPKFLQAMLHARDPGGADTDQLLMQVHSETTSDPGLHADIENALAHFWEQRHDGAKAEHWYRESLHTFESQRAQVNDEALRLSFFTNGDTLYRDYADFLIAANKQALALDVLDSARARTLADGLKLPDAANQSLRPSANARAVAAASNASILFYSLGPKSYLWAINAQRIEFFELPARAQVESLLQRYQKDILRSADPLHEEDAAAMALYKLLIAPAAVVLNQHSKVIIIADGALHGLNFETLIEPAPERLQYWIEDVTLENAASLRLIAARAAAAASSGVKKLLLIGDPLMTGSGFPPLPNAGAEIAYIEKHFTPDHRLRVAGGDATPAAYAAHDPQRYAYIHFVAHGVASRLSPLDSAVVLSADPTASGSFKLYAHDIVGIPLHADLVTISACDSSGARTYAGEGVAGLAWAFLRAGSHQVIGALWQASDASSPLIMDRLYGELQAGKPASAALREAKLQLIHSQGVFRKPLYWGAFQLYVGS